MTTGSDPQSPQRRAMRERQSFVRHELRAPLAVMYPALSMLLDGSCGELGREQRQYVEMVQRNAERLEGLVSSTMDSGWMDCAAAPAQPSSVSLMEIAAELVDQRRRSRVPSPRIALDGDPGGPCEAWADRDQVRQIIADIFENAAHFTPASGLVKIRTASGPAPQTVTIALSDSGCGIPAEELPRVCEFGFRGAAATEAAVPGMGLGLWICRELARGNGGTLTLESELGAGTTATVTLPAAPSSGG